MVKRRTYDDEEIDYAEWESLLSPTEDVDPKGKIFRKRTITAEKLFGKEAVDEVLASAEDLYGAENIIAGNPYETFTLDQMSSPEPFEISERVYNELLSSLGISIPHGADLNRVRQEVNKLIGHGGKTADQAISEIVDMISNMAYQYTPERIVEDKQLILGDIPGLSPEAPVQYYGLMFELDTSEVDKFIKNFSGKTLLSKDDVEEMQRVVYQESAIASAKTAVDDFLTSEFLKTKENLNLRYDICVEYYRFLHEINAMVNTAMLVLGSGEPGSGKRQGQLSAIRIELNARMRRTRGGITEGGISPEEISSLVDKASYLLVKADSELEEISSSIEFLMSSLSDFLNTNEMYMFSFTGIEVSELDRISSMARTLSEPLSEFSVRILGSVQTIGQNRFHRTAGEERPLTTSLNRPLISGGEETVFSYVGETLMKINLIINEFIIDNREIEAMSDIWGYEALELLGKGVDPKSLVPVNKSNYGFRKQYTNEGIDFVFNVTNDIDKDLKVLGFKSDVIDSVRAIMSDTVLGRSGLDTKLVSLITSRILQRAGA